ncbi:MAG: hypothetical protein H0X33_02140 [Taibaiella sp.]|nr:hypothetical protein [Taibaiella sp.]
MRKLQLIKPWGLRTVRQRLNDTTDLKVMEGTTYMPCMGPVATDIIAEGYLADSDIRQCIAFNVNPATQGPRAEFIHTSAIQKIRG